MSITISIPENTSVTDFAIAVANVLKEDYGNHNFSLFIETLEAELKPKPQLKPIREWLDEIPDEIVRQQAIENWEQYSHRDKYSKVQSLSAAIKCAFVWVGTKQGGYYWRDIADKY